MVLILLVAPMVLVASADGVASPTGTVSRALSALAVGRGSRPVLVFALPRRLTAGSVIRVGGPTRASARGLSRSSSPVLVRVLQSSWFFYEDLAPYQQFGHPGRVALVNTRTGRVWVSRKISWPPVINGHLPVFLSSQAAYDGLRYQVFSRPYTTMDGVTVKHFRPASAHAARGVEAALDPAQSAVVARLLASQHACVVEISDTLRGGYYAFARVAQSRAALDFRFSQLKSLAPGFASAIYPANRSLSPVSFAARQLARGCQDMLVYLAGGGYSGASAVNVGMTLQGSKLAHRDVTLSELRTLVSSHPGVHFEFVIDAPHASGFQSLAALGNVLLVATPMAPGGGSFTYLPAARTGGKLVPNTTNPLHLLQLTYRLAFGIDQVIGNPAAVAQLEALSVAGKLPSAMAYLLGEAFGAGGPVDFATAVGAGAPPQVTVNGFTLPPLPAPANSPPTAGSVSVSTDKHTAIDINVLASASDPDGDTVHVAAVDTTGTKGLVSINPDGTIHYDPNGKFSSLQQGETATDTFTYRASDGYHDSNSATVTVTINGVSDPVVISNVESTPLSYRAQDAAVPITSALTLSDDDDRTMASATVSIISGFKSSADTLGFTNQNGITGSYNSSTGALTLSGDASLANYQAALRSVTFFTSDGSVSPAARTVSFSVTDSVGDTTITPAMRTINVAEANQPPVANNVSYSAVGNTTLAVGTSPTGPAVTQNDNLLNHASDPDSGGPVILTGNTNPAHGTLTINSDGTFTYVPNAGFTGTDTFTYTVTDEDDAQNPKSATGTVTLTVGTVVWYVDNSKATAGDGRSASPFNTLAAANSVAGANSIIFLYQGNATYTGGVSMKSGEDLFGQPHGLTVGGFNLVAAGGSTPTITNTGGAGITLGEGSDVEAVNVSSPSGNGITAPSINSATVGGANPVAISGAGGNGINISGGNGTLNFGTSTVTGSAGHSVSVASRAGGTVSLGGSITDHGTGISLSGNTGATINFTGTLDVSTGANPGFSATGGGTVSATGTGSTITSSTTTALNVSNTTIAAAGLKFQSISSNGANPGINLSGTGTSGGLTVTGTGTAGSGGTIQNSAGNGINLSSTTSPSFTDMLIQSNAVDGIIGSQVNGFTLASSTVSGNGGTGMPSNDTNNGLDFSPGNGTGSPNGLTGTVSITNSTITGSDDNNVTISDTSGTLNLTVTGSTISNTSINGNDGLHVDANDTASATVSITGSTFTNSRGDHFQFSTGAINTSAATGTNRVTFSNNTLNTTSSYVTGTDGPASVGGGVRISPGGNAHTTITIDGNAITNAVDNGIGIDTNGGTGTLSGTVHGNTIGTPTVTGSKANDIGIFAEGSVTETLAITNNDLYHYAHNAAIYYDDNLGNPTMNLTITGNTLADPDGNATQGGVWGILGEGGALSTDNGTVCAAISGNSLTGSGQPSLGTYDVELDQAGSVTYKLPGYTGGPTDTGAVQSFVAGNNNNGGTPNVLATTSGTSPGFVGGTSCPTPP